MEKDKSIRRLLLLKLAIFVTNYPALVLLLTGIITLFSLLRIPYLEISTSRARLAPADNPIQKRYTDFLSDFGGGGDTLIMIVEGDNLAQSKKFVTALAPKLLQEKEFVENIFYKLDVSYFKDKALLYLPKKELQKLASVIKTGKEQITEFANIKSINEIFDKINLSILKGVANKPPLLEGDITVILLLEIFNKLLEESKNILLNPEKSEMKVLEPIFMKRFNEFSKDFDPDGFMVSHDKKMIFIFIQPASSSGENSFIIPFVDKVEELAKNLSKDFPGVKPVVTGVPATTRDEMKIIKHDMLFISVVAIILIIILYWFSYRSLRKALLLAIPISLAALWDMAITQLTIGYLNLLSSVFTAVIFGLGDDFSVHIFGRYEDEIKKGYNSKEALQNTLIHTGEGIITGAISNSTAFFMIAFSSFKGFAELGIITGTGLLLVAITALTVLPALIIITEKFKSNFKDKVIVKESVTEWNYIKNLNNKILKYPKVIILSSFILTGYLGYLTSKIEFNYNIMELLPKDTESVRYQYKMIEESDFTSEFNAIIADNLKEAEEIVKKVEKLPTVARVESLSKLLPEDQEEKISILENLKPLFKDIDTRYINLTPVNIDELKGTLINLKKSFEDISELVFSANKLQELDIILKIIDSLDTIINFLNGENKEVISNRLQVLQELIFNGLKTSITQFKKWIYAEPVDINNLPSSIKDRYISKSGLFAVYIFPKGPIWDRNFLEEFIEQTKKIDDKVTGFPVNFFEFGGLIKKGFIDAAIYSTIAIIFILIIDFRSLYYAFLALIPLAMGAIWMLGLINLTNLQYNFVNLVALPLIIGMGVQNGVHFIHRYREEGYGNVILTARYLFKPITIAALTTILGIGSVGLATHRGLSSLGFILVYGITSCMITTNFVLPSILMILEKFKKPH